MKKICTLFLAVIMIAALTIPVFAEETVDANGGTTSVTVNGIVQYTGSSETQTISVDLKWSDMVFYYTEGHSYGWDPETHQYAITEEGSWGSEKGIITVTNHSNTDVTATLSFEAHVPTVTGAFTETSGTENDNVLELASAVEVAVEDAATASAEFGLSGSISESADDLGAITVRIEAAEYVPVPEITMVGFTGSNVKFDASDVRGPSYTIYYPPRLNLPITPTVVVAGNNLHTITNDDHLVALMEPNGTILCSYVVNPTNFTVDVENHVWTSRSWELIQSELQLSLVYSNDGGETWVDVGYVYFAAIED